MCVITRSVDTELNTECFMLERNPEDCVHIWNRLSPFDVEICLHIAYIYARVRVCVCVLGLTNKLSSYELLKLRTDVSVNRKVQHS